MAHSDDFRTLATVDKNKNLVASEKTGVWRGTIEYNQDPLQLGRVKVRILELDGEFEGGEVNKDNYWIPTEKLPWARVMHQFGGGYDYGNFTIPPIGSTCFVMFEKSDPRYRIVIGYWCGSPKTPQKFGTNPDETLPTEEYANSMGKWYGKNAPEPPLESQGIRNHDPTRQVLYKSPKGHTIVVDDRDEGEFIEILDRTGQGIRFECYVTKEQNKGNKEQRGLRSVFRGDAVDRSSLVNNRARIIIRDLAGSEIEFDSKNNGEKIKITACRGKTSDEKQIIELLAHQGRTTVKAVKSNQIQSSLSVDSSGNIEVKATNQIKLSSPNVVIQGYLRVEGSASISGDLDVGGTVTAAEAIAWSN